MSEPKRHPDHLIIFAGGWSLGTSLLNISLEFGARWLHTIALAILLGAVIARIQQRRSIQDNRNFPV